MAFRRIGENLNNTQSRNEEVNYETGRTRRVSRRNNSLPGFEPSLIIKRIFGKPPDPWDQHCQPEE